jgi:hypothetical protein
MSILMARIANRHGDRLGSPVAFGVAGIAAAGLALVCARN